MGPRLCHDHLPGACNGSCRKGPCTADKLKFCRESTADVGAICFCLLEHKDELSGACEARLQGDLGAADETRSDN